MKNTDRNDTVKHVWTRHMIHTMDLEPDAMKDTTCDLYGSFSMREWISLTIDSPVWGMIYERYIFRVFFSRQHENI